MTTFTYMHGVLEPLPTPRFRTVCIDSERNRVLIVVRRPGKKLCARIMWSQSSAVLISSVIQKKPNQENK
jgi:hypothetical protein